MPNGLQCQSNMTSYSAPAAVGRLKPEPAGAALPERLLQFGQDALQFAQKRPGRIDDQETGRGQGSTSGLRSDAKLQPQAFARRRAGADRFRDLRGEVIGGAAAFYRVP